MTSEHIYQRALRRAIERGVDAREAEALDRDAAEEWYSRRVEQRREERKAGYR